MLYFTLYFYLRSAKPTPNPTDINDNGRLACKGRQAWVWLINECVLVPEEQVSRVGNSRHKGNKRIEW